MATPTVQSEESETSLKPSDKTIGEATHTKDDRDEWMGIASFVLAGVAVIGLLVVIFGLFLTPSELIILIGACIVTLDGIGWVIVATTMLISIIRRWLSDLGKANTPAQPTRPE